MYYIFFKFINEIGLINDIVDELGIKDKLIEILKYKLGIK